MQQQIHNRLINQGFFFDGKNYTFANDNGVLLLNFETGAHPAIRGIWGQADGCRDVIFFDFDNKTAMNNLHYWLEWYKLGGVISQQEGTIGI